MCRKKVLVVGPLPPEAGGKNKGGVAYHVWHLANALNERDLDVEVLPIGRYFRKDWGRSLLGRIKWLPNAVTQLVSGLLLGTKVMWALKGNSTARGAVHAIVNGVKIAGIKKKIASYDLVHVHGCYNSALPLLREVGAAPLVVTVHSYHGLENLSVEDPKFRYFRANMQCADAVINVSEKDAEVGRALGLSGSTPSYVVYNGVAIGAKNENTQERKGLVFVGGLIPRKRADLLVKAWRKIGCRDTPLVVIGEGPQEKVCWLEGGREKGLTFYGALNNEETRGVIRASQVLVVPSLSESFGLVYVEAMLEGAAVIGYGPLIREFQRVLEMDEEERALVVDLPAGELAPAELASTIEGVLRSRASGWGEAAMMRIRNKAELSFSWDKTSQSVVAVYDEIIGERSDAGN